MGYYHQDERDRAADEGAWGCLGCLAILVLALLASCSITRAEKVATLSGPTADALSQTWTSEPGEPIVAYVMVDPDTGIQYIVTDRGGICPRLDASGSPYAASSTANPPGIG